MLFHTLMNTVGVLEKIVQELEMTPQMTKIENFEKNKVRITLVHQFFTESDTNLRSVGQKLDIMHGMDVFFC